MSDIERATVTSSSSHLETVQPFTIDESPGLKVGVESPKLMMDSSTLMCTSIGRSPTAVRSSDRKPPSSARLQKIRTWTNSNQESKNKKRSEVRSHSTGATVSASSSSAASTSSSAVSSSTSSSNPGSSDDASQPEDFATNQSAKSTATGASSGSSKNARSHDCNTNKASDEMGEYSGPEETSPELSAYAEDSDGGEQTAHGESSTDAGATGLQSTDSAAGEGEESDSVFANFAETTDAASTEPDRAPPRQSNKLNKNDIANMIEKAILDFCSSRTVETMRRMFAGVTNDTETLQRDGGRHDDKSAGAPHPVTGELVKEGVIIGDVDVFAPRMQREFILPVRDSLVECFLKEPGVFRAICYRTRCQVEVTRRILNRKLCVGGRWHKYMVIRICGPTFKLIENCDVLLQKAVPTFALRKVYHTAAVCRMFLREDVPDNAELYFNFQRTGGTSHKYGSLKLDSPYRQTSLRSAGCCPWKLGLFKVGKLAMSSYGTKQCMKHVYPSLGYQTSNNLESEYQGVHAVERITHMHEQFQVNRQAALALKRSLTVPVCR